VKKPRCPLESAAGDDVLVRVAGQQAEMERHVVRGQLWSAAALISGFIRTSSLSPAPSVPKDELHGPGRPARRELWQQPGRRTPPSRSSSRKSYLSGVTAPGGLSSSAPIGGTVRVLVSPPVSLSVMLE
jgi:hypothetical protein